MGLFFRRHCRHKDGKDYVYWSLVENRRTSAGKIFQRPVYYLGELTEAQRQAWQSLAEQVEPVTPATPELGFDRASSPVACAVAPVPQINFSAFTLHHPRQWGACWIADRLWHDLHCDEFWSPHLPPSREGTRWLHNLRRQGVAASRTPRQPRPDRNRRQRRPECFGRAQ